MNRPIDIRSQSFRSDATESMEQEMERLRAENEELLAERHAAFTYIRKKVNQLLVVMGTVPLKAEELNDSSLLSLDPIGIVSDSFGQVLRHLNEKNEELRQARNEIRAIFDSAGAALLVVDVNKGILDYNNRMKEIFFSDLTHEEVIGQPCSALLCSSNTEPELCTLSMALTSGTHVRRNDWVCKNRHFNVVAVPLRTAEGVVSRVILSYADITDIIDVQQALSESEERYRDIFENASDLVLTMNSEGRIQYANPAWRQAVGWPGDESKGDSFFDVVEPGRLETCRDEIQRAIETGISERIETELVSSNGNVISVEGNVSVRYDGAGPVTLRGIFRDVTETRKLQEELLKAQKLESLGILAGGIAHDFNNLLTTVMGNVSLLDAGFSDTAPEREILHDTEMACVRAQDLTRQLLTFAKGGAPVKSLASIRDIARDSVQFVLHGSKVSARISLPEDLMPVNVDVGQISQVLQNLTINALQAMPEGGTIEVWGTNLLVEDSGSQPVKPGPYVSLHLQDQGTGIPEDLLGKIFDPFFTTKTKGSGLGLATCYSIMKKHGGHISVESTPGSGSTFQLLIPASPGDRLHVKPEDAVVRAGEGRILVMDDQEMVLRVACNILEHVGYEVDSASDGSVAVEMYRKALEAGTPYTAVVLDLTIPGGMGGEETMARLKEIDPQVKAIVASGYANDAILAHYRDFGFSGIVSKPYNVSRLVTAVQSLT